MGVLDGREEAAISPAARQTGTARLSSLHLAAVLHSTGIRSGASLPGEVSLGMGAAKKLLSPPVWEASCVENTHHPHSIPSDSIPTGSCPACPELQDESSTRGESKIIIIKIKIAAHLPLHKAKTCRCHLQDRQPPDDATRLPPPILTSLSFPPSSVPSSPHCLILGGMGELESDFQPVAGVGEFPQGISFLPHAFGREIQNS